jgi:two-component system CheB/CheR fusion protein
VIDTGIGIQPEVLPRIFDAFQQGSGDVTKQFGGLGLGLAITKVLVQLHGGSISAESAGPGRGSRFTVQLPLVAEPSRSSSGGGGGGSGSGSGLAYSSSSGLAHIVGSGLANVAGSAGRREVPDYIGNSSGLAATAAAAVAAKRERRRILLVEDHEDTAMIMSTVLRHQGHVVRRAASVAAALQAAQAEPFDLVISDIGLPDGSGLDLMRQLRLRQPVRGIALSGFGMEDDVRRSRDAGFDEHLTKPVSLEVLESTLKRVVDA